MQNSVWIGYDGSENRPGREDGAFSVARHSLRRNMSVKNTVGIHGLVLSDLRKRGFYWRAHRWENGQLWDVISDAPMATEFAITRFLVPHLARGQSHKTDKPRWALFVDCDMLFRDDVHKLFAECDDSKAAMVVKHKHQPKNQTKMDGQLQTAYARKNWSSVCAFNIDHPANEALTPSMVNSKTGRELHGFCWLRDDEIGGLHPKWNYLVGHSGSNVPPAIVHFTDGVPDMPGYESCEYADEYRAVKADWARRGWAW